MINKDTFNRAPKLKVELVKLTDDSAYIRELTGKEYSDFEKKVFKEEDGISTVDNEAFKYELIGRSLCDKNGGRILNDDEINKIGEHLTMADVLLLTIACRKINKLDEDIETLAGK